jgi:hypothetical protein
MSLAIVHTRYAMQQNLPRLHEFVYKNTIAVGDLDYAIPLQNHPHAKAHSLSYKY